MRTAFLLSFFTFLCFRATAVAVEIDCVASQLRELAGEEDGITELKLNGTIDAYDFDFISSSMTSLQILDLSSAEIKSYSGHVLFSGVTASKAGMIPPFAFFGSKIESITLPAGTTEIGEYAFAGSRIRNITTGEKILSIGEGAFKDCESLEKIEIKGNVNRLASSIFDGCTSLGEVILSHEVDTVGARAFAGCTNLKTIPWKIVPRSVADEAFAHSGITEIDWAGNSSLIRTGERVFTRCDSLKKVNLPGSLTEIAPHCFFGDAALSEISFDNTCVSVIDNAALAGCCSIETITLPESIEYLGDKAMALTTGLRTIDATRLQSVPELGSDIWSGVNCESIELQVNPALINQFSTAPQWRDFNISTLSSVESPVYDSTGNISATFDGTILTVASPALINRILLWNIDGRQLLSATPLTNTARIETSRCDGQIFIIGVSTDTGNTITFKIKRK